GATVVPRDGGPAHPAGEQALVAPRTQDVQLRRALAVGLGGDPARTRPPSPQRTPRGEIGYAAEHRSLRVEEGEKISPRCVELVGRPVVELDPRAATAERLQPERQPPPERRCSGTDLARLGQIGGEGLPAADAGEGVQGVGRGEADLLLGAAAGMRAGDPRPNGGSRPGVVAGEAAAGVPDRALQLVLAYPGTAARAALAPQAAPPGPGRPPPPPAAPRRGGPR